MVDMWATSATLTLLLSQALCHAQGGGLAVAIPACACPPPVCRGGGGVSSRALPGFASYAASAPLNRVK